MTEKVHCDIVYGEAAQEKDRERNLQLDVVSKHPTDSTGEGGEHTIALPEIG